MGKNAFVSLWIKSHFEIISGESSLSNIETLFQLIHDTNYEAFVNSVTSKMVQKFAKKVFKKDTVEVFMNPE